MIVDGKKIAEEVLAQLQPAGGAPRATLGVVLCGGNVATDSYVRMKSKIAASLGVEVTRHELAATASTEDFTQAVCELAHEVDALIVQLPLPEGIDLDTVFAALPPHKDIDALGAGSLFVAPVALAVLEIFKQERVSFKEKNIAVVGQGRLVGAPVARELTRAGASVHIYRGGDSLEPLCNADIIVSGVGKPGIIIPSMLKAGAVLIDAGTSEQSGKLVGDIDPACAEVASVYTPVPGGVGPIAIAMLFKNFFTSLKQS